MGETTREREIKIEKNPQPGANRRKRYNKKPVSTTSKFKGITELSKHALSHSQGHYYPGRAGARGAVKGRPCSTQ